MNKRVLLVEPNYNNKFPPVALMKLSTYHKMMGDSVVFFKGDLKTFELEQVSEKCVAQLNIVEPGFNWKIKQNIISDFIKTRKADLIDGLGFDKFESEILLYNWLVYYKNYYWKKEYLQNPEWDCVYITTLFTFYFDITVETINEFKQLVKPDGYVMVGGVLATLQPEELEKATGIKPYCGLLSKPGQLGDDQGIVIDSLPLDYTILEEIDYRYPMSNAYYGYLTRGCIRHCAFCAVPKLEDKYQEFIPINERIERVREVYGEQKDLLLMDNNVMASKKFDDIIQDIIDSGFGNGATFKEPNRLEIAISNLKKGINDRAFTRMAYRIMSEYQSKTKDKNLSYTLYDILYRYHLLHLETTTKESLIAAYEEFGPLYEKNVRLRRPVRRYVDFNQGVDARLFTPHMAEQFARIAINPLRIAFDNLAIKDTYVNAITMCANVGLKRFSNYLLYNFKDKPVDLYKRLEINVLLCDELDVDIFSFPMKYHPLYNEHSHDRNYIGEHWNMRYVRSIQAILNVTRGAVGRGTSFFYRAFGKTEEEYLDILLMPDVMIIYRFFFEWLESIDHPYSYYKWKDLLQSLTPAEREEFVNVIKEVHTLKDPIQTCSEKINKLLEFYGITRDDVTLSNGSLHILKDKFDEIDKDEVDAILTKLNNDFSNK